MPRCRTWRNSLPRSGANRGIRWSGRRTSCPTSGNRGYRAAIRYTDVQFVTHPVRRRTRRPARRYHSPQLIDGRAPMRDASQDTTHGDVAMRKTTMSMALGLALSLGAVGAASAQSTQQPQRQEQGERGMRRGGPGGALLKGITLTADQKARLQELRKNEQPNPE